MEMRGRICGALRDFVPFVQFKKAEACNFTKINTPPWVFLTFFKLYKWHQIVQRTTFKCTSNQVHSRYNVFQSKFVRLVYRKYGLVESNRVL